MRHTSTFCRIQGHLLVATLVLPTGCTGPKPAPKEFVTTSGWVELPDDQAAKLTKETLEKIRLGMPRKDVYALMGQNVDFYEIADTDFYEAAWKHSATGRVISVRFQKEKVIGKGSRNLP